MKWQDLWGTCWRSRLKRFVLAEAIERSQRSKRLPHTFFLKQFEIVSLVCILCFSLSARAGEGSNPKRISIAILPPQNVAGETNLAHWSDTISILTASQLREEKKIFVLPQDSIDFAYQELKLQPGQNLEPEQVRQLGGLIEARQVLRESYQQKDGNWNLTAQIINVRTGNAGNSLSASSPDLFQAISEIRRGILRQFRITPTKEEEQKMDRPPTSSHVYNCILSPPRFFESPKAEC